MLVASDARLNNAILPSKLLFDYFHKGVISYGVFTTLSATELYWNYDYRQDVFFELVRNGAVLTQRDGSRSYDEGLSSYTTYDYEVIAIDRASGVRRSLGSVKLMTNR